MDKDKLVLADGTEINLESSQGIAALNVAVKSKAAAAELWEKFSTSNLKEVQIKNTEGNVTGKYEDMVLDHIRGVDNADGTVQVTFCLCSRPMEDILLKKIAALEAGQQTQDAAIGDLGQAVSDIAEGGTE